MHSYGLWLVVLYNLAAVLAIAEGDVFLSSAYDERCPKSLESTPAPWTDQEGWAWEQICLGKRADLSKRPDAHDASCDVTSAAGWNDDRVVTPEFIETVLFYPSFQRLIPRMGFRIRCAKLTDDLDISRGRFEQDVWFEDMYFEKDVVADGLHVGHGLSFAGSVISGVFTADGAVVGDSLVLSGGRFYDTVSIRSAKIESGLFSRYSHFYGDLIADHIVVTDTLYIEHSRFALGIQMNHATVGGGVSMRGSSVDGLLTADHFVVGGDLHLGYGHKYDRTKVDPTTYRDAAIRKVEVEGDLNLAGITVAGTLDFTGGRVGGNIVLGQRALCELGHCGLVLRDLSVEAIDDYAQDSWRGLDGAVDLVGFRYRGFDVKFCSHEGCFADRPVGWLLSWLKMQHNPHKDHLPMPYLQLANALRQNGYEDKANRIMIAAKHHYRRSSKVDPIKKILLFLEYLATGYGYRGWQSMVILIGLICAGAFFFTPAPLKRATWQRKVSYSLDKAIPIITLDEQNKKLELSDWRRGYFYFHAIAGFVLMSVFVASVIGIVQ